MAIDGWTPVRIEAEEKDAPNQDGTVSVYDLEYVQVEMAGLRRVNGDEVGGATHRCTACDEPLYEYADGDWRTADGDEGACGSDDVDGVATAYAHTPSEVPLSWLNWVQATFDRDEVVFTASDGDPRGAQHAVTLRRDAAGVARWVVDDSAARDVLYRLMVSEEGAAALRMAGDIEPTVEALREALDLAAGLLGVSRR